MHAYVSITYLYTFENGEEVSADSAEEFETKVQEYIDDIIGDGSNSLYLGIPNDIEIEVIND